MVRGRTITSWPSVKTDLRNAGAEWVDEEVVECSQRPQHVGVQPQARRSAGILRQVGWSVRPEVARLSVGNSQANCRPECTGVGNVTAMLLAALRDLQWRRRRFVIAIVGTSVVFAMTLVLTGLSNGFRVEAENTVDSLGIDEYLIKAGSAGPFLGASPFAAADLQLVDRMPGVMTAVPLVYAATTGRRRRYDPERERVRGAGAGTRDARRGERPGTIEPGRDRGVEHTRPRRGRGSRDRFAHTASRRNRRRFHGAGRPAQSCS